VRELEGNQIVWLVLTAGADQHPAGTDPRSQGKPFEWRPLQFLLDRSQQLEPDLSISCCRDASYCRAALLGGSHSTPRGEMAMSGRTIVYWVTTAFVVFNILAGGLAELAQLQGNAEGMRALGYPLYVMMILGTWKVLGSVALLVPRFPRLKEWAYAGIFFNMSGAAISHILVGDEAWHAYYTSSLAIVTLVSWALRPESRTLGSPLLRLAVLPVRRTRLSSADVRG